MSKKNKTAKVKNPVLDRMLEQNEEYTYENIVTVRGMSYLEKKTIENRSYSRYAQEKEAPSKVLGIRICLKKVK
jgi:hypothetical protein